VRWDRRYQKGEVFAAGEIELLYQSFEYPFVGKLLIGRLLEVSQSLMC